MTTNPILGKIILQGSLICQSPLHIGSGSGQRSDMDVVLDANGVPFIPATSFVGVLRHSVMPDGIKMPILEHFWGYAREQSGQQSTIRCSDLMCKTKSTKTVIRDGIKINNARGIVEKERKYDYELVERGTRFKLNMEFSYRASDKEFVRRMVATIYTLLRNEKIRLGAKTNSGFGEIRLLENTTALYEFVFSKATKKDVLHWLTQNFSAKKTIPITALGSPFDISSRLLTINASFWLKNSLIVRSYSADPRMPDAAHITSDDKWVLPGTSLKGAVRARAERIVNSIFDTSQPEGKAKANGIIKKLFGYVEEGKKNDKKKAKIRIKETVLPEFVSDMQILSAEMQNRIKIDRFTGGTIESALFDTMPLFSSGTKPENVAPQELINVQCQVQDCQPHEVGLLLLVLKDLWTGDLAIGGEKNIGRGVLQGVRAIISWNGEKICIEEDLGKLTDQQKETLQGYVDALNSYPQSQQEDTHE